MFEELLECLLQYQKNYQVAMNLLYVLLEGRHINPSFFHSSHKKIRYLNREFFKFLESNSNVCGEQILSYFTCIESIDEQSQ